MTKNLFGCLASFSEKSWLVFWVLCCLFITASRSWKRRTKSNNLMQLICNIMSFIGICCLEKNWWRNVVFLFFKPGQLGQKLLSPRPQPKMDVNTYCQFWWWWWWWWWWVNIQLFWSQQTCTESPSWGDPVWSGSWSGSYNDQRNKHTFSIPRKSAVWKTKWCLATTGDTMFNGYCFKPGLRRPSPCFAR